MDIVEIDLDYGKTNRKEADWVRREFGRLRSKGISATEISSFVAIAAG